jgi:NAD(P)-dependent dehydrogenase (short-subunit alcohol dehydrogenase family)
VLFADLALRPEAEETVRNHSPPKDNTSGRAVFQKTDVSQWKELEQMFWVAEKEFGSVDLVVPGAGVYEPVRSSTPQWASTSTKKRTDLEQFLASSRNPTIKGCGRCE